MTTVEEMGAVRHMMHTIRSCDLGDDVIYAVGRTPTLNLLVINTRPVSRVNREHAQAVVAASRALRAESEARRQRRRAT